MQASDWCAPGRAYPRQNSLAEVLDNVGGAALRVQVPGLFDIALKMARRAHSQDSCQPSLQEITASSFAARDGGVVPKACDDARRGGVKGRVVEKKARSWNDRLAQDAVVAPERSIEDEEELQAD